MKHVVIGCLCLVSYPVMANQDVTVEAQDRSLNQFLNDETQKTRELKLLGLDVQKTGLELKKQQMMSEISKLNAVSPPPAAPTGDVDTPKDLINLEVCSIMLGAKEAKAVMRVNHVKMTVAQGDVIAHGQTVEQIHEHGVKIKNPDGTFQDIPFLEG